MLLPALLSSLALGAEPARFAYLAAGARVCADPALRGPCFSLRPPDQRGIEDAPSLLRYLGEEGGAVALEVAPAGSGGACSSLGGIPAPSGLLVYAARSDVLAATTREVRVEGGDGTAAVFAAGTPLLPRGRSRWSVHPAASAGLEPARPLRLPADAIGLSYPANAQPSPDDLPLWALPGSTAILLRAPAAVGGDTGLPARDLDGAPGGLVELRDRCAIYQVDTDPSAFELRARAPDDPAGGAAEPLEAGGDELGRWFWEQTPLTWEGGGPAGALLERTHAGLSEILRRPDRIDEICWLRPVGYPLAPGAAVPIVQACQHDPQPPPRRSGEGWGDGGPSLGGEPVILGALDKPQIDAVIRENLGGIRSCYRDQLAATPDLRGKVVIKFVIARDGSVTKADVKSTTLNNPTVEGCLTSLFPRLRFPAPPGGGIVVVSYPFLFSPGT